MPVVTFLAAQRPILPRRADQSVSLPRTAHSSAIKALKWNESNVFKYTQASALKML